MSTNQLYGLHVRDLEMARIMVEERLGVELVPHESLYFGGEYYRTGATEGEHYILRKNLDMLDNEPAEPEFPDVGILLYVERTVKPDMIKERLTSLDLGIRLLKQG